MSLSRRSFTSFVKSFFAAILCSLTLVAAPALGQPGRGVIVDSRLTGPRFIATAVSFKARDETGWDWTGSDEVVVSFADFQMLKWGRGGRFGGVDSPETHQFPASVRCIAPQPECRGGAPTLRFGVIFFEEDGWVIPFLPVSFCPGTFNDPAGPPPPPAEFEAAFDSKEGTDCGGTVYISSDDIIGRAKVNLTQADLVALLPAVGNSVDRTVRLAGGSGKYDFTYRITRLRDAELVVGGDNPPPIGPLPTITLQAEAGNARVQLTWSGATTSSVDIYRNGAKIATTANDGLHVDSVGSGTYQYRVCDLNSTTACSATVTVTVT